jgi:hypothetical protein
MRQGARRLAEASAASEARTAELAGPTATEPGPDDDAGGPSNPSAKDRAASLLSGLLQRVTGRDTGGGAGTEPSSSGKTHGDASKGHDAFLDALTGRQDDDVGILRVDSVEDLAQLLQEMVDLETLAQQAEADFDGTDGTGAHSGPTEDGLPWLPNEELSREGRDAVQQEEHPLGHSHLASEPEEPSLPVPGDSGGGSGERLSRQEVEVQFGEGRGPGSVNLESSHSGEPNQAMGEEDRSRALGGGSGVEGEVRRAGGEGGGRASGGNGSGPDRSDEGGAVSDISGDEQDTGRGSGAGLPYQEAGGREGSWLSGSDDQVPQQV